MIGKALRGKTTTTSTTSSRRGAAGVPDLRTGTAAIQKLTQFLKVAEMPMGSQQNARRWIPSFAQSAAFPLLTPRNSQEALVCKRPWGALFKILRDRARVPVLPPTSPPALASRFLLGSAWLVASPRRRSSRLGAGSAAIGSLEKRRNRVINIPEPSLPRARRFTPAT